eukprot:3643981-Prymnesium_polylepis.1
MSVCVLRVDETSGRGTWTGHASGARAIDTAGQRVVEYPGLQGVQTQNLHLDDLRGIGVAPPITASFHGRV